MKTSVNVELTKKCNASCITCPREAIKKTGDMNLKTFELILKRVYQDREKISMVNLSGYGETILHKDFFKILENNYIFAQKKKRIKLKTKPASL